MTDFGRFANPFGAAPQRMANPTRGQGRSSGVISIEQLASMFGLPSWDKIEELNLDYTIEVRRGYETEEEKDKAEEEAQQEIYKKWHDAVEGAAESLFGEHGLELLPKAGLRSFEYKIEPTVSWKDAANKIRETINGVGDFHFNTTQAFLSSGPYTAREAVLEHLGYIRRYPDVYGSGSAKSAFDRAWR